MCRNKAISYYYHNSQNNAYIKGYSVSFCDKNCHQYIGNFNSYGKHGKSFISDRYSNYTNNNNRNQHNDNRKIRICNRYMKIQYKYLSTYNIIIFQKQFNTFFIILQLWLINSFILLLDQPILMHLFYDILISIYYFQTFGFLSP